MMTAEENPKQEISMSDRREIQITENNIQPGMLAGWSRRIVNLTKIIWLSFWLFSATVLVTFPILLLSLLHLSSNIIFAFVQLWARIILKATGVSLLVTGNRQLDKKQSYVIISNHQSHFDGPALAAGLGLQFRWIAKQELLKIPVFGHALRAAGNIFIDRSDHNSAMQSIRDGVKRLPAGAGIMVFAEGTRSEHGRIGTFKKGGFIVAIQTGFPILPVTIKGSSLALPKGGIIFNPGQIELVIGEIIDPAGYSLDQVEELVAITRETIVAYYQSQDLPSNKQERD